MHPAISPDGRRVAFVALGDLWLGDRRRDAVPERLTTTRSSRPNPVWSPDGQRVWRSRAIVTARWISGFAIYHGRSIARSRSRDVGVLVAGRADIAFLTPTSELHVVRPRRRNASGARAALRARPPELVARRPAVVMSSLRRTPRASVKASTRCCGCRSIPRSPGSAGRTERWFTPAAQAIGMRESSGPVWSPDGTQMAAIIDGHLATFPVARDGTPLGPPRRLSPDLASTPSWTGTHAPFSIRRRSLPPRRCRHRLASAISYRDSRGRRARASGTKTVHAGRLFDGRGGAVRAGIDIVIEGRRIRASSRTAPSCTAARSSMPRTRRCCPD